MRLKIDKNSFWLFILIFLSYSNIELFSYFAGDGFIGKLNYYGPILSYVLIILYCMSQPRKPGENVLNCGFKLNIVPYIAAILYTVIIFLLNGNGMDYLSRLVSTALYYMLAVGAMYEMLQLMGCRVLDYYIDVTIFTYLLSAFTGTIISRGRGLSLYVRETFLGHYVGTNSYKGFFEVHELLFIMGLFIIFLLFFKKQKNKKDYRRLIWCILCFIFGFKRIGLAGIVVVVLLLLIINKPLKGIATSLIRIETICAIVICFIFVYMILDDSFIALLLQKGIADNGRSIIYSHFRTICNFSVGYLGKGYTFVSRYIEGLGSSVLNNMASIRGLHSGAFEKYVELGFIGSLLWHWWFLYHISSTYIKKFGKKMALCYLMLTSYSYITYLTDNTHGYRNFQIVLLMIPIAYFMQINKGRNGVLIDD